jgi:MOSC domain-containing protein YiiM
LFLVVLVKKIVARVTSVHAGSNEDLSKDERPGIQIELDGIVGDRHQSHDRPTWPGDKQPEGTIRRNERQWSAVSVEELADIQDAMDLSEPLTATCLGANLCLSGLKELSRLPKGTLLKFPSGAELIVEEYNPPCQDMGKKVASKYTTRSGEPLSSTAFSKAAKLTRGVVGVVEVAGTVSAGDEVTIEIYETPTWLVRSPD